METNYRYGIAKESLTALFFVAPRNNQLRLNFLGTTANISVSFSVLKITV